MSLPSPQQTAPAHASNIRRPWSGLRDRLLTFFAAGVVLAFTFGLGPFEASTHQMPTSLASLIP